jgi:rubrerythrin
MVEKRWICVKCGTLFDPLEDEENFSFNCPECSSIDTKPYMIFENNPPNEWEK